MVLLKLILTSGQRQFGQLALLVIRTDRLALQRKRETSKDAQKMRLNLCWARRDLISIPTGQHQSDGCSTWLIYHENGSDGLNWSAIQIFIFIMSNIIACRPIIQGTDVFVSTTSFVCSYNFILGTHNEPVSASQPVTARTVSWMCWDNWW